MDYKTEKTPLSSFPLEELVLCAQSGDSRAVSDLITQLTPVVKARAAFYGKSGILEMDDLVQEGLLGLLSAIGCYLPGRAASFKTYAVVCINHRILSALKQVNRKKDIPYHQFADFDAQALEQPRIQNPEELVIATEQVEGLHAIILNELSRFENKVLNLYLEGLSYESIALQLAVSQKAVDNALQRIRRKLKEKTDMVH